jgi:hypothetical protein
MHFETKHLSLNFITLKIYRRRNKPRYSLLIDYLKEEHIAALKRVGSEIVSPAFNNYNRAILTAKAEIIIGSQKSKGPAFCKAL